MQEAPHHALAEALTEELATGLAAEEAADLLDLDHYGAAYRGRAYGRSGARCTGSHRDVSLGGRCGPPVAVFLDWGAGQRRSRRHVHPPRSRSTATRDQHLTRERVRSLPVAG